MGVLEAASSGDRLKTLEAMRDKLAADLDEAPAAVSAQIAGRLQALVAEIDEIKRQKPTGSVVDELRKRRESRLSAAEPSEPAGRPKRVRGRPRSG